MKTGTNQLPEVLSRNEQALIVTQLFRLLFGGYLAGLDQYHYTDLESAWTVSLLYGLVGLLTVFFLMGKKKPAIFGLIALSLFFLVMESIYTVVYFAQPVPDPSLHDPTAIWWATAASYLFPLLTLGFALGVYRELRT
jgi:hypothetical protein